MEKKEIEEKIEEIEEKIEEIEEKIVSLVEAQPGSVDIGTLRAQLGASGTKLEEFVKEYEEIFEEIFKKALVNLINREKVLVGEVDVINRTDPLVVLTIAQARRKIGKIEEKIEEIEEKIVSLVEAQPGSVDIGTLRAQLRASGMKLGESTFKQALRSLINEAGVRVGRVYVPHKTGSLLVLAIASVEK